MLLILFLWRSISNSIPVSFTTQISNLVFRFLLVYIFYNFHFCCCLSVSLPLWNSGDLGPPLSHLFCCDSFIPCFALSLLSFQNSPSLFSPHSDPLPSEKFTPFLRGARRGQLRVMKNKKEIRVFFLSLKSFGRDASAALKGSDLCVFSGFQTENQLLLSILNFLFHLFSLKLLAFSCSLYIFHRVSVCFINLRLTLCVMDDF